MLECGDRDAHSHGAHVHTREGMRVCKSGSASRRDLGDQAPQNTCGPRATSCAGASPWLVGRRVTPNGCTGCARRVRTASSSLARSPPNCIDAAGVGRLHCNARPATTGLHRVSVRPLLALHRCARVACVCTFPPTLLAHTETASAQAAAAPPHRVRIETAAISLKMAAIMALPHPTESVASSTDCQQQVRAAHTPLWCHRRSGAGG